MTKTVKIVNLFLSQSIALCVAHYKEFGILILINRGTYWCC